MSQIKTNDKFTYNSETKKYVFHTAKKFGKNHVFSEDKVNNIIKLYSNYNKNSLTMGEISLKLDVPKQVVKFVLQALGKTHDSVPFTDEKIGDTDENELVEEMHQTKSFNILQRFEKEDWKLTQEDADKWRNFKYNNVDPFASFLQNWNPPKYVPTKASTSKPTGTDELLIGASDWHYGLYANERYLYNQKEWNIEKTVATVKQYALKLKTQIENNKYKTIRILFLGDLLHTLTGFTDKGTKLEANPIGEEQLEKAFDSIVEFVKIILEAHNDIRVYSCPGNHSALGDYTVSKMLEIYFKDEKRLKFDITNKRHLTFKVYDSLFLMDHGYAAVARNRLPSGQKPRETYINNLFMSKPEQFHESKRFYYLSGDQHHSESYELTNVEGFMFPTIVGGCRHADNSGYRSRSSQTALVVNKEGVSQILRYYFD